MKRLTALLGILIASNLVAAPRHGPKGHKSLPPATSGRPHATKNNSYFPPHQRTEPNSTKFDDGSTKGKAGKNTGKHGSKHFMYP